MCPDMCQFNYRLLVKKICKKVPYQYPRVDGMEESIPISFLVMKGSYNSLLLFLSYILVL